MIILLTFVIGFCSGVFLLCLVASSKDKPLVVDKKGKLKEFNEADIYN